MARVKTFVNGGSLLPGDLNSIEDDYEFAFSSYHGLVGIAGSARFDSTSAGTFLLLPGPNLGGVPASGNTAGLCAVYFDPADFTANTRVNKLRIRASALVNNVAPAVTFTVGLYPITSPAGAAGSLSVTLGGVVAGSTVAFASPAVNSPNQLNSGDFTAPAAGYYALGVVVSGAAAASSGVGISARVQMRQV